MTATSVTVSTQSLEARGPGRPSPAATLARLQKERLVSGAMPLAQWLAVLGPVALMDRRGDTLRAWLGGLSIAGFIGAVVLLMAEAFEPAAGAFAVAVVLLVSWLLQRRKDLADHLRCFLVPLLRVLREDASPEGEVELTVRLTDRFDKAHSKGKVGGVESFEYPWCRGKARLLDGSTLEWEVVDEARRWSVTKRGSSGKMKTKTKVVVRSDVTVRLGAKADSYAPRPPERLAAQQHVSIKSGERRHVVTAQQAFKRKGLGAVDLPLSDLLAVIALAYRSVGPINGGVGGPAAPSSKGGA